MTARAVSIVGAGRLGTSLGRALAARGYDIRAVCDISPARARGAAARIGSGRPTSRLRDAAAGDALVFITVPDDAIERTARALAAALPDWSGRVVFHASGFRPASALDPLRARGAATAALHPVQSFPGPDTPPSMFRGIAWGIQGDPKAVAEGLAIARRLGGHAVLLEAGDKPSYHAACALASNGTVLLLRAAGRLLAEIGWDERLAETVLLPLVEGTLQNVKKLGAAAALSGPLTRGDRATMKGHRDAMKEFPAILSLYEALARTARDPGVDGAAGAGRVRPSKRRPGRGRPLPPASRRRTARPSP